MRKVAAEKHMKPISFRALEAAIDAAAKPVNRWIIRDGQDDRDNQTTSTRDDRGAGSTQHDQIARDDTRDETLFLSVAKDITVRDAFQNSSWYGPVAGAGPRYYRSAGPDYGPFIDFWAVCICHTFFGLFLGFFWTTISIFRPRVILGQSDKVCGILRSSYKSSNPEATPEATQDEEDWSDQAGGDFIRCWVGKITLVEIAAGKWSLLLHRFDCGFMSYRPDLTWYLHELNILLGLKSKILVALAARHQGSWGKLAASAVQKQSEDFFQAIGLTSLWEEKLQVRHTQPAIH